MKKAFYFIFGSALLFCFISVNPSFAQQSQSGKNSISLQKTQTEEGNDYGTLWGWGLTATDIFGIGGFHPIDSLIQIGKDHHWKMVSYGDEFVMAIKSDGTLWGTGKNQYGQLGNNSLVSVNKFQQIGDEADWQYISAGTAHCLAVKTDGSLWVWGKNSSGILGDITIANDSIQKKPVNIEKDKWKDVVFVQADSYNSIVIRRDGSLWMWGRNNYGQIGDGTKVEKNYPVKIGTSNDWLTVSCGEDHTTAVKKDGTLWSWGRNQYGTLGDGTEADQTSPIQIGSEKNWLSVSVSKYNTNAIKKDGTLWGWGTNMASSFGDTTVVKALSPIQIGKDNDWVNINHHMSMTTGIKKDGSLWGWGTLAFKFDHQKLVNHSVPVKIVNVNDVILTDCGGDYVLYIRKHIPTLPVVTTLPITAIRANTAESGGNVTSDGTENDAVRGVCYATKPNPTITDSVIISGSGEGEYLSTMANLKPFTKYYVRAYVTNTVGTAYGQEETFVTNLETPILVSPENVKYEVLVNTSLLWNEIGFAQKYRVQISNSSTFDSLLADEYTDKLKFDYDKYELEKLYFWRVRAFNDTDSSQWSAVWEFTTSKFYPQELTTPGNGLINIPLDCKLNWKDNILHSSYHLQISKKENFTNVLIDTVITDIYYDCVNLEYLTQYFWRVQAVDIPELSAWSTVWKFTTLMDSVNLTSPIKLSININIPSNFIWEKGIYNHDYRLQISESNNFSNISHDSLVSKINSADLKNLNYNKVYFWRVRNESGDTLGYWSNIWQFKTRISNASLIYPADMQTGLEQDVNFKWNPVIGAEYYHLQVSKNDKFTELVYSKDSITATEHFIPDLEKDVLYYWRVRVWNTESIGTAYWGEAWTFRTGESSVKGESNNIQIIPNPANDYITISFKPSEGSEIIIYNTLGEMVISASARHDVPLRLNISDLPKGIYFVKVDDELAKFVIM